MKRNTAFPAAIVLAGVVAVAAVAALVLTAERARAMGAILGQSKEELKLKYDVAWMDHHNGRVTVTLSIADEGRLKPLSAVVLTIPGKEKEKDGGRLPDLWLALATHKGDDGKSVASFELTREWAERAEIWLMASRLDGKQDGLTSYSHIIPVAKHLTAAEQLKNGE